MIRRATALAVLSAMSTLTAAQTPSYFSPSLLQPGLGAQKCIEPASNTDGAAVVVADCTGSAAQQWTFTGGRVTVFGNKCLDVPSGNTGNGVGLQIWSCNDGNPNQQWWYTGDRHLAWTGHGKCLDLAAGSLANGNRVHTWDCSNTNPNQVWNVGYMANQLPHTVQNGQTGYNNCTQGASSQNSMCQTAWFNGVDDFCLWGPPTVRTVGDAEREVVAWCTNTQRGTRVIPDGTLTGVHFVKTPDYIQITGTGDFTKINIPAGDDGGELDPHGPDGNGNPVGGLVYGNSFHPSLQYHEWTSFQSSTEFCFRACTGPNAARNCQHIYDIMGCYWNMPANYDSGVYESCDGDNAEPMGVYGTSTWYQGVEPTPAPHPRPSSSNCVAYPTISANANGPTGTPSPTSPTPTPTPTPTPSGAFSVRPFNSAGQCLQASSDSDGATVTIQSCNDSAEQQWTYTNGQLKTRNNKCLDVTNGSHNNGVKLQVWTCGTGNPNQQWSITGDRHITWTGQGKCLDLTDGNTAPGNQIQVWDCSTGNPNQDWARFGANGAFRRV